MERRYPIIIQGVYVCILFQEKTGYLDIRFILKSDMQRCLPFVIRAIYIHIFL